MGHPAYLDGDGESKENDMGQQDTDGGSSAGGISSSGPAEASVDASRPIDVQDLLDRCLGDVAFAQQMLDRFRTAAQETLREIEAAAASLEAEVLAKLAHGLKGTAANLGAGDLRTAAMELETRAKANQLDNLDAALQRLRHEVARLVAHAPSALSEES